MVFLMLWKVVSLVSFSICLLSVCGKVTIFVGSWDFILPQSECPRAIKQMTADAEDDGGGVDGNAYSLLVWIQSGTASMEISVELSQKAEY